MLDTTELARGYCQPERNHRTSVCYVLQPKSFKPEPSIAKKAWHESLINSIRLLVRKFLVLTGIYKEFASVEEAIEYIKRRKTGA